MGEHILGDSGYMLRPYLLTPSVNQHQLSSLTTIMDIKEQGLLLKKRLDGGNEDFIVIMVNTGRI